MSGRSVEFHATIQDEGNGGTFVVLPSEALAQLGQGPRKRLKVNVLYDGLPYRGTISVYGGLSMLLILKEIREKLNKQAGDTIHVEVALDDEPRVIEIPDNLRPLLEANPQAFERWNKASFTTKREFARWVTEAKREETRQTRLQKTIQMLLAGETL